MPQLIRTFLERGRLFGILKSPKIHGLLRLMAGSRCGRVSLTHSELGKLGDWMLPARLRPGLLEHRLGRRGNVLGGLTGQRSEQGNGTCEIRRAFQSIYHFSHIRAHDGVYYNARQKLVLKPVYQ